MQKLTDYAPVPLATGSTEPDLNLVYALVTGRYGGGELQPYTSYGVEIRMTRSGRPEETARVEDITTSREQAEQLLHRLRRNRVTPVTLRDVIEDTLGVCSG